MTDRMCAECGWLIGHHFHEDVHGRMKRYEFEVDGVLFRAVLPWDGWPQHAQEYFIGLVRAQKAKLAQYGQWRIKGYHVGNYAPELDAIRYDMELERVHDD